MLLFATSFFQTCTGDRKTKLHYHLFKTHIIMRLQRITNSHWNSTVLRGRQELVRLARHHISNRFTCLITVVMYCGIFFFLFVKPSVCRLLVFCWFIGTQSWNPIPHFDKCSLGGTFVVDDFNTINSQKITPKKNNDSIVRYDIAKECDYSS